MEKSKKNKKDNTKENDKLLTVLLIILIIVSIILVIVKIINGNVLKNDDEKVMELHNYFNPEILGNCDGLYNYADKLVNYKDLNSDNKLCLAYQKANKDKAIQEEYELDKGKNICTHDGMIFKAEEEASKCVVNKFDKKVIDDVYKKIFGQNSEDVKEFRIDNLHVCYKKDDAYYCGLSETYTYTIGNESTIYRVLNRAVEKGSDIEIYDYFIKVIGESCYTSYTAVTANSTCTTEYIKKKEVDTDFMQKYGKEYKHTFKKAKDGSYYWVSSEPVVVKK